MEHWRLYCSANQAPSPGRLHGHVRTASMHPQSVSSIALLPRRCCGCSRSRRRARTWSRSAAAGCPGRWGTGSRLRRRRCRQPPPPPRQWQLRPPPPPGPPPATAAAAAAAPRAPCPCRRPRHWPRRQERPPPPPPSGRYPTALPQRLVRWGPVPGPLACRGPIRYNLAFESCADGRRRRRGKAGKSPSMASGVS